MLLVLSLPFFLNEALAAVMQVDLLNPVSQTGPMFIGVTMDSSYLAGTRLPDVDLSSKSLRSLTRGLTPGYLRLGGTDADRYVFNQPAAADQHTLSEQEWGTVHQLIQLSGWDLIFDLNVNLRHNGAWDPTNARSLLRYSSDRQYHIPCFQLGNEPNHFRHKFNYTLSPQALHADYRTLRSVLNEFPSFRNSCIVGPEVTKLIDTPAKDYFTGFMQEEQKHPVLDVVGLHHYLISAKKTNVTTHNLTDPHFLDTLKTELHLAHSIKNQYRASLPLWLSETGSAVGTDLVDGYVDGLAWLDKLGLSALYGFRAVVRQSFFHHLMDRDYNPLPDYFVTLLHKRLVQGAVFKATSNNKEWFRAYAHCANRDYNPAAALTVIVINTQGHGESVSFAQFKGQQMNLYILTAGDGAGLNSRYIALNGQRLSMVNEELPSLPPRTHQGTFTVPPKSFGFVVFPQANVTACGN